jgi:hypothetical protein
LIHANIELQITERSFTLLIKLLKADLLLKGRFPWVYMHLVCLHGLLTNSAASNTLLLLSSTKVAPSSSSSGWGSYFGFLSSERLPLLEDILADLLILWGSNRQKKGDAYVDGMLKNLISIIFNYLGQHDQAIHSIVLETINNLAIKEAEQCSQWLSLVMKGNQSQISEYANLTKLSVQEPQWSEYRLAIDSTARNFYSPLIHAQLNQRIKRFQHT